MLLTFIFLVLHAGVCSSQVPSWQIPTFQSASMSDHVFQSLLTQSGVTQQEGNLLQESLLATKQIQRVSEASQVCEVEESSRVGCGEPGIGPAECEALECCYDNRLFIYDGPLCYYGNAGER